MRRTSCETHLPNAFRIAPAPCAFLLPPYVAMNACAPILVRIALHAHAAFFAARSDEREGGFFAGLAASDSAGTQSAASARAMISFLILSTPSLVACFSP